MCSCPEISSGDLRKWYWSGEVWQENETNGDMKIVFRNNGSVWHSPWVTYPFQNAQDNFQMNVHDPEGEGSRFWAHVL